MKFNIVSTTNHNPQEMLLKDLYKKSMKVYRDTVDGAKSRTLQELYTDEFKLSEPKSNKTTVKILYTDTPLVVSLDSKLIEGRSTKTNHRLKNSLITKNGAKLGSKTFGFNITKDGIKTYEGGFIRSSYNDEVAGVQIRLLQSAIEASDKNGVSQLTLTSLLPAVRFHSMMGFRPSRSFNVEVKSIQDINRAMESNAVDFRKSHFSPDEVTPILSKKDGKFFFDRNRTFYCASMKHNENVMKSQNKRNLSLDNNVDETIDMVLQGREFNRWLDRIKGFEILPEGEINPRKGNKFQIFMRYLKDMLRS